MLGSEWHEDFERGSIFVVPHLLFILFNRIGRYAEGTENLFLHNPYSAGHRKVKIMLYPFTLDILWETMVRCSQFNCQSFLKVKILSQQQMFTLFCRSDTTTMSCKQCPAFSKNYYEINFFCVKRNDIWANLYLLIIQTHKSIVNGNRPQFKTRNISNILT